MFKNYRKMSDTNITMYFSEQDSQYAELTLAKALRAYSELKDYFTLEEDIPEIRIILVPNRDEFDRFVADLLHVPIERPSDPRRVAQPQKTDIVFMSPSSYENHCAYTFKHDEFERMIKHELTHVFEEYLTPDMEISPGWWSEGLAVYLSDQWQYKSQFEFCEPVSDALESGNIPSISEILSNRLLRYTFGWTIVMYLEQIMGRDLIVRTVKTLKDEDLLKAVGTDPDSLQKDWSSWLTTYPWHFR